MPRPIKPQSEGQMIKETFDRTKRIETRLTSALIALGVTTHSQRPRFFPETPDTSAMIVIPSKHCSMKDIIDSIPETCHGTVGVFVGSDKIAEIEIIAGRRV